MRKKLLTSGIVIIVLLILSIDSFAVLPKKDDKENKVNYIDLGPQIPIEVPESKKESLIIDLPSFIDELEESLVIDVIEEGWSEEDQYLLAKIAMAEAESEDTEGKALVIMVVLNRVHSKYFPNTVKEVIYQKGQFSPIGNGRYDRVEPNEDCFRAIDLVLNQEWNKSDGALYFESESDSEWHRNNLKFLFRHGNHIFYSDKEE